MKDSFLSLSDSKESFMASGDTWFVEGVADWSGRVHYFAMIIEFRDGKIVRDTRYYAEPFEAPAWRTPFVERMESDPY